MDYGKLIEYAGRITATALLVLILVAGQQRYWVFGTEFKEMVSERDTWKDLALKGTKVAEQATSRALPLMGVRQAAPIPLPNNPTPYDVSAKLNTLRQMTAYNTEPTDAPLP